MIEMTPAELSLVKDILQKFVPTYEVRVFGSRIGGRVKRYSDLDLALVGDGRLSISLLGDLQEEFQESDLPF